MLAIARRELGHLLGTPAGWLLAAGTQAVLAWWYLSLVERYRVDYQAALVRLQSELGSADLIIAPFLGGLPLLALLVVTTGVLGIRAVADERRKGTLALLLGSPRRATTIVVGKYLGNLAFLTLLLALWLAMPASLALLTPMDWGRLASAALGLWLAGAALLALGLFTATLSRQAGVGALLAFTLGLLLMLTGQGEAASVTRWLNLPGHYRDFLQGIVGTGDIAYFLALAVTGLALAVWRLDAMRDA